ncbi:MAG TPA: hypothetical protein VNS19_19995 [Acidimicrobiales bacterium]|nr:hypothetical protein [Acidimicrobiales bacterium]
MASTAVERAEADERARGWLTLAAVAAIGAATLLLLFLAPIAYWFITGNGPLDGID